MDTGLRIHDVQAGSIAQQLGIKAGDHLLALNGRLPDDIMEYKELILTPQIEVRFRNADGLVRVEKMNKDPYAELGLIFETSIFNGIKVCGNNCDFCFVRQLPKGMRPSLYVKDDDYRLSFLEGSFITLTNLRAQDFQRIVNSRLSPLYISVHATNPKLRHRLMSNPRSGQIMTDLRRLADGGIQFHLQLVLVPGVNDGAELERSISDIASLGASCLSLGVVPVGLTGFRQRLPGLRGFTTQEAREVLGTIYRWQARFYQERGQRVIYGADEFYLTADYPFPQANEYEGYPQLENGIGLTRLFWDEFSSGLRAPFNDSSRYLVVTGVSGARAIQPVLLSLPDRIQKNVGLVVVPNGLFGGGVTVTGLLGGRDISTALRKYRQMGYTHQWTVLVPHIIFNRDGITLDDLSLKDLAEETGFSFRIVQTGTDLARLWSKSRQTRYVRCLNG